MLNNWCCVISAGGLGSRIREVTHGKIPKPLLQIGGTSVIERQIGLLTRYGVGQIVVSCSKTNIEYFRDLLSTKFPNIELVVDQQLNGNASWLEHLERIKCEFIISMFGDLVLEVDIFDWASQFSISGDSASSLVHPNNHPNDSDLAEIGFLRKLCGIHTYPHESLEKIQPNDPILYAFAGVHLLRKDVIQDISQHLGDSNFRSVSMTKHVLRSILDKGQSISCRFEGEYCKDMGTPVRYQEVIADVSNRCLSRRSSAHLRSAVILDRDGVIIEDAKRPIGKDTDIELEVNVAEGLNAFLKLGFLCFVATNQPWCSKGDISVEEVHSVHRRIQLLLARGKALIHQFIFCPHHPDLGFAGEARSLKVICDCRKPNNGMLELLIDKWGLRRNSSYYVGDKLTDLVSARKSGLIPVFNGRVNSEVEKQLLEVNGIACHDLKDLSNLIQDLSKNIDQILALHASNSFPRFITICGPAGTGKSNLARRLCATFRSIDKECCVIPLDGFKTSDINQFAAKFDGEAIASALVNLLENLDSYQKFEIPLYDKITKEVVTQYTLDSGNPEVVILEGVGAASLLQDWKFGENLVVYCDADQSVRRERFMFRNPKADEERFYERESDEVQTIDLLARNRAHLIIP